jgi:hypothetical protein
VIGAAGIQQAPLAHRGLRPVAELAQDRPHGDRLRYLAGCKCFQCRRANSAYEAARKVARKAGDWNGIVAAENARAHLAALSAVGVGRRAVGDACDVSDTILSAIISGRKTQIRARTERAILAVTETAAADRALIPAAETWRYLDSLIADGYSKADLARYLGYKMPALQLSRDQVTVRNAYDVQRLYLRLCMVAAAPTLHRLDALAGEGYTRRQILERLAALAAEDGEPPPDLTVRKGRIRADAERFVLRLHKQLME